MAFFKKNRDVPEQEIRPAVKVEKPAASTIIGSKMSVKGDLRATEPIQVEGKIQGKIFSENLVVIGRSGYVKADIKAREVRILGRVVGNVDCGKVTIEPEGVLEGNISSPRMVLSDGAVFKGQIDMSDSRQQKIPESESAVKKKSGESRNTTD